MLIDDLKAAIANAVKTKDEVGRDVLRLAFGELQTAEARAGRAVTDEEGIAIVRKLVKSNEETLAMSPDGAGAPALHHEIAVLSKLLPVRLSVEQLVASLEPIRDALRAAKGDGPATGVAMKHLKAAGASFEGNDVTAAVKLVRA